MKEKFNLQFSKINIDPYYREKWNIHSNDFICLTRNGKMIRETLYRIGGLNNPNLDTDNYFMLLKHVEAFYSDDITKIKKDKPHLESRWCILNKDGDEKVEFKQFQSPYLIDNSQIYSIYDDYYNIETGEFYGNSNHSMIKSKDFIFIDNNYTSDESKKGVLKINKKDGTWELFK